MKHKLFTYCLIGFSMMSFSVNNNASEIGVGINVERSLYYSKDRIMTSPFLELDLSLGNFYMRGTAGIGKIGYEQPLTDNFSAEIFVTPFDGFPIKAKDLLPEYQSIKERKTQFTVGGGFNYYSDKWNAGISLEGKGGKRGASGNMTLIKAFPVTDRFVISPYISATYYSSQYTRYYFGIKKSELGGNIKSVYKPKSAYSTSIGINTDYAVTKHLGIGVSVGWDKYSEQIKKSPIIKKDSQIISSFSLYYTF